MWPWGHIAVGYLLFVLYGWLADVDWPRGHLLPAAVAVFATQIPDLIDKPLAWWFHVIPSGRSLAHSVFAVGILSLVFWLVVRRLDRDELVAPFVIGYSSHLFADGWQAILAGHWNLVSYFFYPLTPAPDYGEEGNFISHFANLQFSPYMWVQIALAVVGAMVFLGIEYRYRRSRSN